MKKTNGQSVCIFSSKGGVGKTTSLLNIAGVFSLQEKKVLIIDFDLTSGAVCTYLGLRPQKTIYHLVDDLNNHRFNNVEDYIISYSKNIDVLSSCLDPRQATLIDPNYIELILEKCQNKYDVVLIDTNHHLNEFNACLLDFVENRLIIVTNDLIDIKNTYNLLKIFNDNDVNNYRLLLNSSVFPDKKYYSLYDIKNTIKNNIDYTISSNFHLKTFDVYVAEGKILTLDKKMPIVFPKVYKTFLTICSDIMENKDEK